jgi:cytochrome c oxidase assembly factor CtaG
LSAALSSISFITIALIIIALITSSAREGAGGPMSPHDLWKVWNLGPGLIAWLILLVLLYCRGAIRAGYQPTGGGAIRGRNVACFTVGWLTLALALISPVAALSEALFSARVAQRELLWLVAAPMLALGRLQTALSWALTAGWRRRLGRAIAGLQARWPWRAITGPFAGWLIFAVVFWLCHTPMFFQAALDSGWARNAQHLGLLASAFIFSEALARGHERRLGRGAILLYIFTAGAQTIILGAMVAGASTAWVPSYEATTAFWGRTSI